MRKDINLNALMELREKGKKKHPEQKENEIFLINAKDGEDWHSKLPEWIESVRYGVTAFYHNTNAVAEGYRPVFAILKEKR